MVVGLSVARHHDQRAGLGDRRGRMAQADLVVAVRRASPDLQRPLLVPRHGGEPLVVAHAQRCRQVALAQIGGDRLRHRVVAVQPARPWRRASPPSPQNSATRSASGNCPRAGMMPFGAFCSRSATAAPAPSRRRPGGFSAPRTLLRIASRALMPGLSRRRLAPAHLLHEGLALRRRHLAVLRPAAGQRQIAEAALAAAEQRRGAAWRSTSPRGRAPAAWRTRPTA